MVEVDGVEGEKILSIGVCSGVKPLSDIKHQQRLKCHELGMTDYEAADECNISCSAYRDWRNKHNLKCHAKKRTYLLRRPRTLVKKFIKCYKVKEMPPKYTAPCKIITIDKYLAEQDLKRWGNKVEPIKMTLAERGKVWNMKGIVIGSSFYTRRM
jgi:hypothetical protein